MTLKTFYVRGNVNVFRDGTVENARIGKNRKTVRRDFTASGMSFLSCTVLLWKQLDNGK